MRPVRTADANITLTLPGGTAENDLPAKRAMLYDAGRGQTEADAQLGFITTWLPTEEEARKLEAGAAVELIVWGKGHPPVAVSVTAGVMPERELISRGHVDRAIGHLYAQLAEDGYHMPPAASFADIWTAAVDATRAPEDGGAGDPSTAATAPDDTSPEAPDDLTREEFRRRLEVMLGRGTAFEIQTDALGTRGLILTTRAHGVDVMAAGHTRRDVLINLRTAIDHAAVRSEHTDKETDR